MGKRRNKQNADKLPSPPSGRRNVFLGGVIILTAALTAGMAVRWWWTPPPPPPRPQTQAATPVAVDARNEFQKLKGRWRRPDGGYVVEVRSVEDDGRMDAAYFNPRAVHVARAQASREEAVTKMFIELRDVNYPGSTYNLIFEPDNDQLHGIYYQAALHQSFEVIFVRQR